MAQQGASLEIGGMPPFVTSFDAADRPEITLSPDCTRNGPEAAEPGW
jgi:hypothetical protein